MSGSVRHIAIGFLAAATVAAVACEDDDDLKHDPTQGGGAPMTGGGATGNGGDDDASYSDAADAGDVAFDREACRQKFLDAAVTNTAWYQLQCQRTAETDDAGQARDCEPGSPVATL